MENKDFSRRKYQDGAEICIVGAGAAGGVLAYHLSKAGFKVVIIEAGPFWDPQRDFASDELSMNSLAWQETRLSTGKDSLNFGHNNSGRGVGGGTVHFTGVFLRLFESDFETKTRDGVGEDWPISYWDLEPYYTMIEKEIAVSGPKEYPWGAFRGPYPYPVMEPISANAQLFRNGCEKLGIESVVTPLAILTAPFDGRPPCINRGFCNQGCLPNAKFSTLIHHIPKAISLGAQVLSDCLVTQVVVNKDGLAEGVIFNHQGKEYEQKADLLILANFCVETPRLLLHSANSLFPQGLANSSGLVGKYLMPHSGYDIIGKFPFEVRFYKGAPVLATSQEFYETDQRRGFARGYTLHAHGSRPVSLSRSLATKLNIWGEELRQAMLDFNYYARVTQVGEVLPNQENKVTLSLEEKDEYGIPLPLVNFSYGDNDQAIINHSVKKAQEIITAAGGEPVFVLPDSAHLLGGCRMGDEKNSSVVNQFCQSHDIPNLYICSGTVFPTSGGANPTETIMALAARTADHLISSKNEATKKQETG